MEPVGRERDLGGSRNEFGDILDGLEDELGPMPDAMQGVVWVDQAGAPPRWLKRYVLPCSTITLLWRTCVCGWRACAAPGTR